MKQPTTRQLINEMNKIERQMKEIDKLGEINPSKEYKRKPSKETRNKQALKGLQIRANKMGINLPQLVGSNSSDKVNLQKQYLKAQLQIKLNQVNSQINAKPVPKTIQVMGKRMKTDGMTLHQIENLKRQVNDYRKTLKANEKRLIKENVDSELIQALMNGKERFKITTINPETGKRTSDDITGSFDELQLSRINPKHYTSAKRFYDDLSIIMGSDLNPNNFQNRFREKSDIVGSIESVLDEYLDDLSLDESIKELKKALESMSGTQSFMFSAMYDIEELCKEIEKYLKDNSGDYKKINDFIYGKIRKINRLKSQNTSISYYNL